MAMVNLASKANVPICPEMKRLTFASHAVLHIVDFCLRVACLVVWASYFRVIFWLELVLMASGAAMSIYITFHDADVLLLLHQQHTTGRRLAALAFFFVVLGCFQVIQVKRAWARQVQSTQALYEMGGSGGSKTGGGGGNEKEKRRAARTRKREKKQQNAELTMPGFADAERIMPVALFTGVPFLLINHIWDHECKTMGSRDSQRAVIMAANVIVALTISLKVADLDYEVSHHIWKRYHLRSRTAFRNLKKLFPLLHRCFRAVEVYYRMTVIIGFIFVCRRYDVQTELLILVPILDYLMGVVLLNWNSPDQERNSVHIIAGLGMIFVDMALFVDRQNFAAPARRISQVLLIVRACEFVFVVIMLMAILIIQGKAVPADDGGSLVCDELRFVQDVLPILISAAWYYSMRYFFPLRRLGDDLHTAAARGAIRRLKQLLAPDVNGQVRDVNAPSKDYRGMTPLMFAAENGRVEAIEVLLDAGAVLDTKTTDGNTCLHLAAVQHQASACTLLVRRGADPRMTNHKGETPWMLVSRPRTRSRYGSDADSGWLDQSFAGDIELRLALERPAPEKEPKGMCSTQSTYQVPAAPTPGLHLHNLFPEVEKDDTPSPRVLQSVSALVVSRAAGKLARCVLARQEASGNGVPLGALKRVRELGKGGFGRVIEVELPPDASRSIWWSPGAPTRYALKLQLKRDQRQAHSEVLALRRAAHPFIVHLERAFSFDRFFALLLELCPTDLNRKLCELGDDSGRCMGLTGFDSARYMGQVLLALAFLHKEQRIVFRDVKPENILISMQDEAKLTDFGLAKVVTSARRMTMCGTAGFLPPECTMSGTAAALESLMNSDGDEDMDAFGEDDGGEDEDEDEENLGSGSPSTPGTGASGSGDSAGARGSPDGTDSARRRRRRRRSRGNTFKIDTYALGVSLQLTLLGEDGGRRRDIHKKGPMLLPLHRTEEENTQMLAQLRANGRLSDEAFDLLNEHLLCEDVSKRKHLTDPKVINHPFFLTELRCTDLHERLMPGPPPQPSLVSHQSSSYLPSLPSMKLTFWRSEASGSPTPQSCR